MAWPEAEPMCSSFFGWRFSHVVLLMAFMTPEGNAVDLGSFLLYGESSFTVVGLISS